MQSYLILLATTSKRQNVLALLCCFSLSSALLQRANAASNTSIDARSIMQRSLDAGDRNAARLHEYASSKRVDEKQIDADGSVRSQVIKNYDQVVVEGVLVRKFVAKDGKPLPPAEARKEEERVQRIALARKQETTSDKAKRLADEQKKRVKAQEFSREILEAFDFRLLGEEQINGRNTWMIEATPVAGYKPKEMRAQLFPHLKGKVWIDQEDLLWARAEATASDPITVGFGIIAKLEQGAHLYFDQTRMPDGVWLLRNSGLRAIAHVAIVKRIGIEQVSTFDNFRKLPAGVLTMEDSTGN